MSRHILNRSDQPNGTVSTDSQSLTAKTSWCPWISQLIHDDAHGTYFAASLNTHLTHDVLVPKLDRRCQFQNTTLNLKETDSHARIRRRGTCVFVLPALSALGNHHCHLLIRVPRLYVDPWMPCDIHERSRTISIDAPLIVREVFRSRFGTTTDRTFTDIHILNDGRAAVPIEPGDLDAVVMGYWKKRTDGEWRSFDHAEWVPMSVRNALPSANTTRPRALNIPVIQDAANG